MISVTDRDPRLGKTARARGNDAEPAQDRKIDRWMGGEPELGIPQVGVPSSRFEIGAAPPFPLPLALSLFSPRAPALALRAPPRTLAAPP